MTDHSMAKEDRRNEQSELLGLIAQAMEGRYMPPLDEESLDDTSGRYVLLERGHYGQTWASFHDSPDEASNYALNQEHAEDWSPEVLIDRETGKLLEPRNIVWWQA